MGSMKVQEDVSLQNKSTFRLAARARCLVEIRSEEGVREYLVDKKLNSLPWFILGDGSNTVFTRDFEGVILDVAIMGRKFQRTTEDFVCENCGTKVSGTGYTNHCPNCLWSKHVDVNPGDRRADCGGTMRPVKVEVLSGGDEYKITHRCLRCGHTKRNKTAPNDNFEVLLTIRNRPTIVA